MNSSEKRLCFAQRESSKQNDELTDHKNSYKKQTSDQMEGIMLEDMRNKTQEYEGDTVTTEMLHGDDSHHGDGEEDLRKNTLLHEQNESTKKNLVDIDESPASHDEHKKKTTDDKNLETVFDVKKRGYSSKKIKGMKHLKDSFVRELENSESSKHSIEEPEHYSHCLNQRCVVSNRGPYKRPHKCDNCEISFRTPYELERHGRTHSGERPFKCQLCDMCFKRKDHVEVHMRRHIEDRRHVCDLCGMWFVTSSCLLRHRRRTHKMFDPSSQIKHRHGPRKIPIKYSDGAKWGEPEENLPSTPKHSVPLEEQRRKCKKSKSKTKHDRTYRPGSKTVCILKKRKLRNKTYSFVELDDDIECFESDEEDRIPCLKIQSRCKAIKQEEEEMITEVIELEHSLFPNSFLGHDASPDQFLPVEGVNKLISDEYIADLREGQLEVSRVSLSTNKDENSPKLHTEESDFGSEDEESEMPLVSCDVSFDEPENECVFSSSDIDSEQTSCSVGVLKGIEGNQNDSLMEAFSEPLRGNTVENDNSKALSKVDVGPNTDNCKTDTSKKLKREKEEHEEGNLEQYNQIWKDIHQSSRERSQSDSSNTKEDIDDTPGLSESHPISHQASSAVVSYNVLQNALLREKNSKGNSFPVVKEDPEKKGTGYKKPHECHLCHLHFRSPSELERHSRIHSGERPYLCELCGSGFIRKCHLQLHMRRHAGERRHTCEECGMMFFTSSDLNRHMLIHKNNKPFKCHICTVTFRRISHLEQHVRRHIDATPFTGRLGESFFTSAALLKKHEKHHSGKDPNSCLDCSASFSTATSLSKHQHIQIDPQFNSLKTSKFHSEGITKSDQYECVSSKVSPLSLVIRRVASKTQLKIPGLPRSASESLESLDADIDDTTQRTMSGWELKDSLCRNKSVWSCKDLSFMRDQERKTGVSYSIRQEIYKGNNVLHENDNQMASGGCTYVVKENKIKDIFKLHIKDQKLLHFRINDTLILEDGKKQSMSKISKAGKICSMVKDSQSQDIQIWKYDSRNSSYTDRDLEHITKTVPLNLFPVLSKDCILLKSFLQQNIRGRANKFLSNLGKTLISAKDNVHLSHILDERYNGEKYRSLQVVGVRHCGKIIRKKPALIISKEAGADKEHLNPMDELKRIIHSKKTLNSNKATKKDDLENKGTPVSSVSQKITAVVVAVCDKEFLSKKDGVHLNVTRSLPSPDQTKNVSDTQYASHVESKIVNQDLMCNVSGKISNQAFCIQSIKKRYLDLGKVKIKDDNENSVSSHEYLPLLPEASTTVSELEYKSKVNTGLLKDNENLASLNLGKIPTCFLSCAMQKPRITEPIPTVIPDIEKEGDIPKPNPMNTVTVDIRHDGNGEDSAAVCLAFHKKKQEDVKAELCPPCSVSCDNLKRIVKRKPATRGHVSVDEGQVARPLQTVLSTISSHEKPDKIQLETRHLSFVPLDKQKEEIKSYPSDKDRKCNDSVTMCPVLSYRIKGNHNSEITSDKQEHIMTYPSAEKEKGQKQLEVDPVYSRQDPVLTDLVPLHTDQNKDGGDEVSLTDYMSRGTESSKMDTVYSEGSQIPYTKKAHQVAEIQTDGEGCRNISLNFQISNILS